MLKRLLLSFASLLVAYPATADTLVTWVGSGEVIRSWGDRFIANRPGPPVGTPLSFSLSFDPSLIVPTVPPLPWGADCRSVPIAAASVTLGTTTFTAQPSSNFLGFTHAALPGSNCEPPTGGLTNGGFTQFGIGAWTGPADAPFDISQRLLILSFRDQLVRDTFPESPTTNFAGLFLVDSPRGGEWGFDGEIDLHALDQSTPVPEPATMTLFALGLAALARKAPSRTI